MKKLFLFSFVLLFVISICSAGTLVVTKDPIKIEVLTKYTSFEDALKAAKDVLLQQKFIAANGIQEKSFTATRTTNAKADYYVADVAAEMNGGKVKIIISFVKVGTGLLKLQKVAEAVKADLEK